MDLTRWSPITCHCPVSVSCRHLMALLPHLPSASLYQNLLVLSSFSSRPLMSGHSQQLVLCLKRTTPRLALGPELELPKLEHFRWATHSETSLILQPAENRINIQIEACMTNSPSMLDRLLNRAVPWSRSLFAFSTCFARNHLGRVDLMIYLCH